MKTINKDKKTTFRDRKYKGYHDVNIYTNGDNDNIKFVLKELFKNQDKN